MDAKLAIVLIFFISVPIICLLLVPVAQPHQNHSYSYSIFTSMNATHATWYNTWLLSVSSLRLMVIISMRGGGEAQFRCSTVGAIIRVVIGWEDEEGKGRIDLLPDDTGFFPAVECSLVM